tara:strand:+ start:6988 stop:7239 length:252 start_codon:yes stop_codon:yes gene_type:complete
MIDFDYMKDVSWRCQMCNQERPDDKISVHSSDLTKAMGLNDMGDDIVTLNTKYCNDNEGCKKKAQRHNEDMIVKLTREHLSEE